MGAALDMKRGWLQAAETARASSEVINARAGLLHDAARSPMTADYAELTRMVPERIDAFARSGLAVMRDLTSIQAAYWTQAQRVGVLMLAGRVPTASEATVFAAVTREHALGAITAGAQMSCAALAPVHRAATANARRMGSAKRRAKRN